ncbi:uncharacterized protein LOC134286243 [Aedes albopictus]|uniref:Reverse transcriptase domain-containing protein n=1 Tax=Aedes albopictus TaxID=7160 RepID=A0ABM1XTR5_AEDAL
MSPKDKLLRQAETETRNFLKDHPELYVLKADKGNKTVVMLKQDYVTRMEQMLSDTHTYERTQYDPTSGLQTKNNDIVRRLERLGLLDRTTAMKLRTYKAVCPKIYGQPKTHKSGLPLRPVVPCMTSPSYELSKFIATILQKSFQSKFNVRDSFAFCQYANTTIIPADHVMVSFDVVSLFTCIPIALVRKSIINHWNEIGTHTNICLDLFLEVTVFCIECSYFCFNGVFYKQKFGTAMGNPLSPIIADLVMEDLLERAVAAVPFEMPYPKKYVDDLFLILPKDKIDEVREIFNQQETSLQFTVEEEQNNRLPFLDLVVIRNLDRSMSTEWYMKPIASAMEASENTPEEDEKLFRSLTNIDGLSSRISKTLKKEYANIQVATKTTKTVGTLLPSIKDKTAKEQQSNVIYKIQCGDCEACYIGMTTTKLKQRISGHRSNVRRLETLRAAGYTNEDAAIVEVLCASSTPPAEKKVYTKRAKDTQLELKTDDLSTEDILTVLKA